MTPTARLRFVVRTVPDNGVGVVGTTINLQQWFEYDLHDTQPLDGPARSGVWQDVAVEKEHP